MTCAHEPEDRMPWEPTTCRHCRVQIEAVPCKECGNGVAHWMEVCKARHCRHCGVEIVPAACAECHGMEFVTDEQGREIDCPDCNGTGCEGWRKA